MPITTSTGPPWDNRYDEHDMLVDSDERRQRRAAPRRRARKSHNRHQMDRVLEQRESLWGTCSPTSPVYGQPTYKNQEALFLALFPDGVVHCGTCQIPARLVQTEEYGVFRKVCSIRKESGMPPPSMAQTVPTASPEQAPWASMLWVCPRCTARVGCHAGTAIPKGTLANGRTRRARMVAHAAFDALWTGTSPMMDRSGAYRWMAGVLDIDEELAHIGTLGEEGCRLLFIEAAKLLYVEDPEATWEAGLAAALAASSGTGSSVGTGVAQEEARDGSE